MDFLNNEERRLKLKSQLIELYAIVFCDGREDMAKAELIASNNDIGVSDDQLFVLGSRVGLCFVLLIWIM